MAGKAKFDQEAAFKSIIGAGRVSEAESQEIPVGKEKSKDRVQMSIRLWPAPSEQNMPVICCYQTH